MWQGVPAEVPTQSLIPSSTVLERMGYPTAVRTLAHRGVVLRTSLLHWDGKDPETTVAFFPNREALYEYVGRLCDYEVAGKIASEQMKCDKQWFVLDLNTPVVSMGAGKFAHPSASAVKPTHL